MRTKSRILACSCSLLSLAATFAPAQSLQLVEGAYEASLADVAFPRTPFGTILIGLCGDCEQQTVPTDDDTRYVGSHGEVSLTVFLAEIGEMRQSEESVRKTMVNVYYSLDTKRATRVSLSPL
jgi:hypothetical protein